MAPTVLNAAPNAMPLTSIHAHVSFQETGIYTVIYQAIKIRWQF